MANRITRFLPIETVVEGLIPRGGSGRFWATNPLQVAQGSWQHRLYELAYQAALDAMSEPRLPASLEFSHN